MLKTKDILDEKDKRLRQISQDVVFPLTKEDHQAIKDAIDYLKKSQIEKLALKYDLRPGMGLAACQLGINKRYFIVVHEEEENTFKNYVIVNPQLLSYSEELIYAATGEGCLSVNREVEGIIPRYARVTLSGFDQEGNPLKIRAREELSIAFQHEIDHLNGILFIDHINSENPYKDEDKMRAI